MKTEGVSAIAGEVNSRSKDIRWEEPWGVTETRGGKSAAGVNRMNACEK